jgi:hypothetical protein
MRTLPACVIGALTPTDCLLLHMTGKGQLNATVFVPAAAAPLGGDGSALSALLRRVLGMTTEPVVFHLPAKARQLLTAAISDWSALETRSAAPLSGFAGALPDLARRLAGAIHVVDCAANGGNLSPEIHAAAMRLAVGLIERFVLPTAQHVLGPVACPEVERDAREMISYLRMHPAARNIPIERRAWMRAWQKHVPLPRFDTAVALLLREKLLVPAQGEDGGQWFVASAEVFGVA